MVDRIFYLYVKILFSFDSSLCSKKYHWFYNKIHKRFYIKKSIDYKRKKKTKKRAAIKKNTKKEKSVATWLLEMVWFEIFFSTFFRQIVSDPKQKSRRWTGWFDPKFQINKRFYISTLCVCYSIFSNTRRDP